MTGSKYCWANRRHLELTWQKQEVSRRQLPRPMKAPSEGGRGHLHMPQARASLASLCTSQPLPQTHDSLKLWQNFNVNETSLKNMCAPSQFLEKISSPLGFSPIVQTQTHVNIPEDKDLWVLTSGSNRQGTWSNAPKCEKHLTFAAFTKISTLGLFLPRKQQWNTTPLQASTSHKENRIAESSGGVWTSGANGNRGFARGGQWGVSQAWQMTLDPHPLLGYL